MQRLSAAHVPAANRLHVFDEIDSTNSFLLDWPDTNTLNGRVCLAEHQSAGRGRHGRSWHDSPGGSIMLSMAWIMKSPALLGGLSLCAGVAIVRVMQATGVDNIQLKWPNDVLWDGRKLGGILVETTRENNDTWRLVTGVGLNACFKKKSVQIDQPWIDLAEIEQQTDISLHDRHQLAAEIIIELTNMYGQFSRRGFVPFRDEWMTSHAHQDCEVRVIGGQQVLRGTAIGVDDTGALQIRKADGAVESVVSGEISVRPV